MAVIPAVELTAVEAVPFRCGQRMRARLDGKEVITPADLDYLTVYMSTPERRAFNTTDRQRFTNWFMVGVFAARLHAVIESLRAG